MFIVGTYDAIRCSRFAIPYCKLSIFTVRRGLVIKHAPQVEGKHNPNHVEEDIFMFGIKDQMFMQGVHA